ncbi:ABC transporter substrate-binding protein [Halorussus salinus]|uniref:ABC transporter substrate-binding protein n=1 Tax=Halorussus salinus TaxID=1364935 RepID=UPI001092C437|nr:ABC transporter substrate-binding protein [Halorussus salinus]
MREKFDDEKTRRRFLKGGTAVGATLLAGCTGGESGDATTTASGTTTTEATETTTTDETETTEETDETTTPSSYSMTMAPVGEVTFERTPETFVTYEPGYADMGVALGRADGLAAVGFKSRYHTRYYGELDGVSVSKEDLTQLYQSGVDEELFYSLDADVHLIDPNWLTQNSAFGLDQSDVERVSENVAPFVGNTVFRRTDGWHDYRYYSMYEAFEKVAEVFRETERYEAFEQFHDSVIADVQSKLPASKERPSAALVWAGKNEPEEFTPYYLSGKGTNKKQFRDLGVHDTLANTDIAAHSSSDTGKIDYESLLEIDPEVLLIRGHESQSAEEFRNTVVQYMKDHEVASELAAVKNDEVFRGGPIYEGPIQNLFLTERFAHDLYPDIYSGELFDRRELAAIVTGDY